MMPNPRSQQCADQTTFVEKEGDEPTKKRQKLNSVLDTTMAIAETKEEVGVISDTREVTKKSPAASVALPVNIEDMDEELLQKLAQGVIEELQKRGASTTLALAKILGLAKSSELSPLLFLLLEKNVLARVSDLPPIWTLSSTFPGNPFLSSSAACPATPLVAPQSSPPAPAAVTQATAQSFQPAHTMAQFPQSVQVPASTYTIAQSFQTSGTMAQPPQPAQVARQTIITFSPIPDEPLATSEPASLPAAGTTLIDGDCWQEISQNKNVRNNPSGGPVTPFQKWKRQKTLSEMQLRILKELKERGPTRTLQLSKIVGLVTCRDVNPSIYDLKQRNLVIKVSNAPPVWQLNERGMTRHNSS